jgi:hypothetical protein
MGDQGRVFQRRISFCLRLALSPTCYSALSYSLPIPFFPSYTPNLLLPAAIRLPTLTPITFAGLTVVCVASRW